MSWTSRIPAALTMTRALLAPVVVFAALARAGGETFGACLVIAFLSDVFDGIIARKLNVATPALRRLDSVADSLFYFAALFAAWYLHRDLLTGHFVALGVLVGLELLRYLVDFVRFRREAAYHMWSSKLWGLALFAGFFAVLVLGVGGLPVAIAIYVGIVGDLEGLAISIILREWKTDVPTFVHAMRIRRGGGLVLLSAFLWLSVSLSAHAGVIDAPGEDLEVSLITYGPGDISWERFGHDAIRIRDRASGESGDFNYGVFDFEDRAFIWNFARGRMRYMIDAESSDIDQKDYIDDGRSVLEQRLALSPTQAAKLRDFLLWNLRPENLSYDYDYLTSNCATRIRDALNSVLGGALKPVLTARPAAMTYRQQIDRLMSGEPALMLAMDFGLGPSADRPLNEWQESFLPMVLARELRTVRVPDGHGGVQSLVVAEREIAPSRLEAPPALPPNLDLPLGLMGLALAAAIHISRSRLPILHATMEVTFLVLAGSLGTVLVALWTLTTHYAAWENANLLVFNPLAFAMVGAAWRSRHGIDVGRLPRTLVAIQLGAALMAVLLHFMSGNAQQNHPWLLLGIPVWLAIAAGIWKGHRGQ